MALHHSILVPLHHILGRKNLRHNKLWHWAVYFKKFSPRAILLKESISCHLSLVSCLHSPFSNHMSPLSCLPSPVLSPISYLPWPASHHPTSVSHILSMSQTSCITSPACLTSMPPVSYLQSLISYLLTPYSCLLSLVSCVTPPVSCIMSLASHLLSLISCIKSKILCLYRYRLL